MAIRVHCPLPPLQGEVSRQAQRSRDGGVRCGNPFSLFRRRGGPCARPCLPLQGRCPVRTLGGRGHGTGSPAARFARLCGIGVIKDGRERFAPCLCVNSHLIPKILPSLFLRPCLVVGMPVALAIFLFAFVTPNARFQLNERPGMILFFLRFAIFTSILPMYYSFSAKRSVLSSASSISFIYPAVIMPAGSATTAIPKTDESIAINLPIPETG